MIPRLKKGEPLIGKSGKVYEREQQPPPGQTFGPKGAKMRDRNARLLRVIRNYFRNEVLPEVTEGTQWSGMKVWLRKELGRAVIDAARGHTTSSNQIEKIIKEEVRKAIADQVKKHNTLEGYIRHMVREVVLDQIDEKLSIDVDVRGRVFSPAKGQRRVNIGEED